MLIFLRTERASLAKMEENWAILHYFSTQPLEIQKFLTGEKIRFYSTKSIHMRFSRLPFLIHHNNLVLDVLIYDVCLAKHNPKITLLSYCVLNSP